MAEFTKYIQILIVLSPLFISVFLLARLLINMRKKAKKHALYWLLLSLVLAVLWLYQFTQRYT